METNSQLDARQRRTAIPGLRSLVLDKIRVLACFEGRVLEEFLLRGICYKYYDV
jgi:hypothetical protein